MQKTTLQKAIEMIDSQMKIVENSKKGKDAKYKFGADAAINNLVMTKITLKGMLQEERDLIKSAVDETQNMLIVNDIIVANLGDEGTLGDKYYKSKFGSLS
jgi:hypothetical protein